MIVIVSELYYPEETSTGYIISRIAEGLAKTYPVRVLTGRPDYSGKKHALKAETIKNVAVERISIPSFNKNRITTRIVRSLMLSVGLAWKALRVVNKSDVVLVVTNPAPILILISMVCKLRGASFIILVHDVFPDNLEAIRLLKRGSLIFWVAHKIFKLIYATADHIIVIGRDMRELLGGKLGPCRPGISVITNWADIDEIVPAERSTNELLQRHSLIHSFVVEFAGNIGRVQGVEYILAAAELLRHDGIHFLFVGSGARHEYIAREASSRDLTNVTFVGALPRDQQQQFLNACDVGLVSLAPGMTGLGVPSKTYNIMAAGKPVIAVVDPKSEIGLMVQEENIGWVVPPGNPSALAAALREAKGHPGLAEMGRTARNVATRKYSLPVVIDQYTELFAHHV